MEKNISNLGIVPIIDKTKKAMKKFLSGIAVVLAMVLATSCGQRQQKNVVEEEVVEAVDATAVTADSLQVAE